MYSIKMILRAFIALLVFPHFLNAQVANELTQKQVNVDVISGTYQGEKGTALVSYDPSKIKGVGEEVVNDALVSFKFLNQTVNGKAQVTLKDGKFKDLLWVASIKNKEGNSFNFGFNSGFNRYQFGRFSESFIRNGDSYFGYLFPDTYVDGAGTITYSDPK
ncbi:hypothetical protein [Legionella shakespearei]|uniref:Uncharacterized protein n=1 Tax=Legionella shakespearei DSM 23087 TaxID=1122169 RepID=A0A0W0YM17_9GAMM|nr:hypothetical protein [Legionella shakespearei]KTD57630.1 hypothetical protein Lsha_2471 [Legionella shakespearei DSM 23087]